MALAIGLISPVKGNEGIQYSHVTLEAQEALDTTLQMLSDADLEYQRALAERNSAQRKVCAQQAAVASLKYSDTPEHMTEELLRLHGSANYARECPGIIDFL